MDRLISYIQKEISLIGKVPLCNERRDRGIVIKGFCLPLCTRCVFIIIGALIGTVLEKMLLPHFNNINIIIRFTLLFLFQIPMMIDGISQYVFYKESTNLRRAITGFLSGFGIVYLCDII